MLPEQESNLKVPIQAKPNLVEGIGGVGDQLPQEDLLVAVKIRHVNKDTFRDTRGNYFHITTSCASYYL